MNAYYAKLKNRAWIDKIERNAIQSIADGRDLELPADDGLDLVDANDIPLLLDCHTTARQLGLAQRELEQVQS